jgi:cold shock CspA family protein
MIAASWVILGLSVCLCADSSVPPSTSPADPESVLKSALLQLSDRDPAVRESAREQLMALSASDLPMLRIAIEALRPLPPGDADALRDIVEHVYLTGEDADGNPKQGFMGILMSDWGAMVPDSDADPQEPLGVVVEMRLPGFDAYRVLRDGDIILAISTDGSDPVPVHSAAMIIQTVKTLAAGQRVRLDVIRNGQRMQTTVRLDARPLELSPPNQPAVRIDDYRKAEEDKAKAFWLARFAQVVDDGIS